MAKKKDDPRVAVWGIMAHSMRDIDKPWLMYREWIMEKKRG